MPNRMMRESALTSPSLNALSDGAERFFWRLVLTADDYGRFDADPRVLFAHCFPLRAGRLKLGTISAWLGELEQTRTVRLYEVKGRVYGYFIAWDKHQRIRTKRSKFPDPPDGGGDFATIGYQRQIPVEVKRVVRERDRVCLACGAPDTLAFDHIVPVDGGGLAVAENLQLLCYDCNAAKGTRTLNFRAPGEAEQAFAAARRRLPPSAAGGGGLSPEGSRNPDDHPRETEAEAGAHGAPSSAADGESRRDANGGSPFASWPPDWQPLVAVIDASPFLTRYRAWLTDLDWWREQDERFTSCPAELHELTRRTAAYVAGTGYRPPSKRGLLQKLYNCLETESRKVETEARREAQATRR